MGSPKVSEWPDIMAAMGTDALYLPATSIRKFQMIPE